MPGPFIFVATNKVRDGRLEAERQRVPGWIEFIHSSEPRLIAFHEYLSADGTEVEYVQVHVLRYLPTHLGAPEIAAELYLSANTVKTHLLHLYRKLSAHSRQEAVQRARAIGLLTGSSLERPADLARGTTYERRRSHGLRARLT